VNNIDTYIYDAPPWFNLIHFLQRNVCLRNKNIGRNYE
jgi:hypothetical protein